MSIKSNVFKKELEKYKITTNQGKDHVNLFHFVDGIKIWCTVTEDLKKNASAFL
ncbi:MAG: hypothetical protein MJ208_03300 [Bacilli bacterium]|nr:hypothetical protein [Bacilli bacterium]